MANQQSQLHVRNAISTENDVDFILAAWDSTLPFLASIGARQMWGDEPFSKRQGQREEIIDIIQRSEENEDDDSRRFLIIELRLPNKVIKAGAAIIRDSLPSYLVDRIDHLINEQSLLYLEVLIADQRHHQRCRGIGRALVSDLKRRARERGKQALYVDFWAGNEQKLNM